MNVHTMAKTSWMRVMPHDNNDRIYVELGAASLFMDIAEARELATLLMNAAVQATPMVELEDAA